MTGQVIEHLYAFITTENENDDEGIIATMSPGGIIAPMVGSDMSLLKDMREHADRLGLTYRIKYFTEVPNVSLLN